MTNATVQQVQIIIGNNEGTKKIHQDERPANDEKKKTDWGKNSALWSKRNAYIAAIGIFVTVLLSSPSGEHYDSQKGIFKAAANNGDRALSLAEPRVTEGNGNQRSSSSELGSSAEKIVLETNIYKVYDEIENFELRKQRMQSGQELLSENNIKQIQEINKCLITLYSTAEKLYGTYGDYTNAAVARENINYLLNEN
jgi:hypothetical protein